MLLGYVPRGSKKEVRFILPKKQWSASRRKFRDLSKKEVSELKGCNT